MKTNENLVSELIHQAESGNHTQFRFLRNWKEYSDAMHTRKALTLLVTSIRKSSGKFFKKYCANVSTGDADVIKLLAYCTTTKALKYYEEELSIINETIHEYEAYLMEGNLLWSCLFNEQRPLDKLWDHRGL